MGPIHKNHTLLVVDWKSKQVSAHYLYWHWWCCWFNKNHFWWCLRLQATTVSCLMSPINFMWCKNGVWNINFSKFHYNLFLRQLHSPIQHGAGLCTHCFLLFFIKGEIKVFFIWSTEMPHILGSSSIMLMIIPNISWAWL